MCRCLGNLLSLAAIILVGGCCLMNKKNNMEQKLYTVEGTEYIIRTASNNFGIVYASTQNIPKYVFFNDPPGSTTVVEAIHLNTASPIIPISYSASAYDALGLAVIADISNCYYSVQAGGLVILPMYRNSLSKIYPYVQRVYYTDDNNNNYISRYNQIIFSDRDFIPVSDPLAISMFSSLARAMTDVGGNPERFQLVAGTYLITITFTYLELQK
jgi:hypothetical protein